MPLNDRPYTKTTTAERMITREAPGQRSHWPDHPSVDSAQAERPPLPWSLVDSTDFGAVDFTEQEETLREWIEVISATAELMVRRSPGSQGSRGAQTHHSLRPLRLSSELSLRLKELVFRDANWDLSGAHQIRPEVAQRVEDLALAALAIGVGEPEVTAASDGSLGVDWNVSTGVVVGLFVSDTETWEPVAIITEDDVRETSISSIEDLISVLARYSRQS